MADEGPSVQEALRAASKKLLGNRARLEVAAAVGASDEKELYAQQLSDVLGLLPRDIRANLRTFAEAGIMKSRPRASLNAQAYFERLDSVYWELAIRLQAELLGSYEAPKN